MTRGAVFGPLAGLALVVILFAASLPASAGAATSDVGYEGPSFSGTSVPTGTKRAESALWWNDGSWWANMWDAASSDFHISRLDTSTQKWVDTGVAVDTRSGTSADVLWDGSHLYVASHRNLADGQSAVSGDPSYLRRYSYDAARKTYSLDSGFPVAINNYRTETLVIDKDSTGKVWATWQQDNKIYVNRTSGDDRTWGTPFALQAAEASVTVDDTSSVVAFDRNRIGIMWSNQSTSKDAMYFAVHEDGQPDGSWQASRTAIQGPGSADDHINLKSLQADGSGRVYAAVKTSFTTSSAPLIMLLARDPSTGDWASHRVARVSDCPNRPIVLIDEENRTLHSFATYPAPPDYSCSSSGGAIYEKTSPLDKIDFPLGSGTPVMLDGDSPYVHNVSSSKQNVTSRTGIATLAVNGRTSYYWHAFQSLPPAAPSSPPSAEFRGTPTTGDAPLAVNFTDDSTGSPTGWSWDFGDGSTSTEQNPAHTYSSPGTYTVKLTARNAAGENTATKVDYITATQPPDFALSVAPQTQTIVRGKSTTYDVAINPIGGFSGFVDLSVSGLPAGASAIFDPNPLQIFGPATSTLTILTTTATKQGNYPLVVTASSGLLQHTADVSLNVKRR